VCRYASGTFEHVQCLSSTRSAGAIVGAVCNFFRCIHGSRVLSIIFAFLLLDVAITKYVTAHALYKVVGLNVKDAVGHSYGVI
jgi:hypothetical protein